MDYQSNSDKSKEVQGVKRVSKVVTGEVTVKPEGLGKKFKHVFFGGDIKSAGRFVLADVMLPAARDLIVDAVINGVKGVIYGDPAYRRRSAEYRPRVNYSRTGTRSIFQDPREPANRVAYLPDQPHPYRGPEPVDRQQFFCARREDAERVVETLISVIDQYQVVTLADLNEMLGIESPHIANKWGWTVLNSAEIRQTRDGYAIDLPPLEAI